MNRRIPLLLLCPLALSCASSRTNPGPGSAPGSKPPELYTYRTTVAAVPAGTARLCVSVRLSEDGPRPLRAYGLVGNAPFEFELAEIPLSAGADPRRSLGATVGPASLSWRTGQADGQRYRELVVETAGKPLELSLRLASRPGEPVAAEALEQELLRGTCATADEKAVEVRGTRLERATAAPR